MDLLNQLVNYVKEVSGEFAEVEVSKDEYRDDMYILKVTHKDKRVGKGFQEHDEFTLSDIMPSKYSSFYYQVVQDIVKPNRDKLYCGGYSECGNVLQYKITVK